MNNTNVQKQRVIFVDIDLRKLYAWTIPLLVFSALCIIAATIIDVTTALSGTSLVLATLLLLFAEIIIIPTATLTGYGIILQFANKAKKPCSVSANVKNLTIWAVALVVSSCVFYTGMFAMQTYAKDVINSSQTSFVLFEIFRYYCEIGVLAGLTLLVTSWILRIIKDRRDLKYRKSTKEKHA